MKLEYKPTDKNRRDKKNPQKPVTRGCKKGYGIKASVLLRKFQDSIAHLLTCTTKNK
jgi:hypothetical protein